MGRETALHQRIIQDPIARTLGENARVGSWIIFLFFLGEGGPVVHKHNLDGCDKIVVDLRLTVGYSKINKTQPPLKVSPTRAVSKAGSFRAVSLNSSAPAQHRVLFFFFFLGEGGPVGHKLSLYMGGWARRSQAIELKCRTTTCSLLKNYKYYRVVARPIN